MWTPVKGERGGFRFVLLSESGQPAREGLRIAERRKRGKSYGVERKTRELMQRGEKERRRHTLLKYGTRNNKKGEKRGVRPKRNKGFSRTRFYFLVRQVEEE